MLTNLSNKDFREDLILFNRMLSDNVNFAFARFSDGEVFMMQGQEILMGKDICKVKGQTHRIGFPEDDLKHFDPEQHEFQRQRLVEAFTHRQFNYFKGLSCRCCIGEKDFQWQLDLLMEGYDEQDVNLTWSNLLINANYMYYLHNTVPILLDKQIVFTLNKNRESINIPFKNKVKEFLIGPNCIVNDYHIIEDIKSWIQENDINNHVFLFAASSLSNMAIHQLYRDFPDNTYIDIGSSLNPFIEGIKSRRDYMRVLDGAPEMPKCIW